MKQRPFIPSWLDDSGMSAAEMRVFVHLCRSADNNTGIAWPSYRRITEISGLGKSTVRRAIEELEKRNLIKKLGKPFAGSCRYQVLPIVPPEGQKEVANSSTREPIESPPIVPPQTHNSSTRGTPIVPPEGQEGSPKKVLQGRKSKREISLEGNQFAIWFKSSLPETVSLETNWQQSFGEIYDKLIRIDKRDPEQIRAVCRWARTENFWKSRFMSPAKLRTRKDGIQYFDVFAEQMKRSTTTGNHHQQSKPTTVNIGGRESSTNKNTEAV